MPFKIVEAQKAFKFTVNGAGLPIAHVERWGKGVWVKCCPLCGLLHEVLKGQTSGEYEPRCIVRVTHPHVFAAWQKAHPEAAKYTRVMLKIVELDDLTKPDISPAPALAIVEKPVRGKRPATKTKATRRSKKAA
jgi:hypothetical protein